MIRSLSETMFSKPNSIAQFVKAVSADYNQLRRYRVKYHAQQKPGWHFATDVFTKIGVQMATTMRLMQAFDHARVPLVPQVISRFIRHAYGAEIHWKAQIEPGITFVHGCGLVVSHGARVGSGCILFHNVTLGESFDAATQQTGAPSLGNDVHVGPGATLLGPITVGDRSKIMAGAVLTSSVPPDSLVKPAEPSVVSRRVEGPPTSR